MSKRVEFAAAAVILLLALGLRLTDLGLLEFKGDEAVAIDLALPFAEGEMLPRVGLVNSVGLRNPPLFVWATAIPTWFSDDARFVTGVLIGFPAAMAVLLTWWILRRRFGAFVALSAAALYAVAPWPVLYGRKLWGQDVLPLFSVALLWVLFVLLERHKTRWVAAIPLLLMALWQLHLSAVGFMAVFFGVLVWRWRRVHWPAFALGCVAALLTLWPYLQHQIDNEYADLKGFQNMAKGVRADGQPRETPKEWTLDSIRWATFISAGNSLQYACGPSWNDFHGVWRTPAGRGLRKTGQWIAWTLLGGGTLLMLAMLLVVPAWSRWQRRRQGSPEEGGDDGDSPWRRPAAVALLMWWVGYLVIFTALRLERVFPHYYIILFPAPFIVMALALGELWRRWSVGRWVAVALLAVVMVANLTTLRAFQTYLHDRGGTRGDYGVNYEHKAELARWIVGTGVQVVGWHEYAVRHREAMEKRYGDVEAIDALVAARGMPPEGLTKIRIWSTLHAPQMKSTRCAGRQDFGPLLVCPTR